MMSTIETLKGYQNDDVFIANAQIIEEILKQRVQDNSIVKFRVTAIAGDKQVTALQLKLSDVDYELITEMIKSDSNIVTKIKKFYEYEIVDLGNGWLKLIPVIYA